MTFMDPHFAEAGRDDPPEPLTCPHGFDMEACWTCTPTTALEAGFDEWRDFGGEA